MNITVSAKPSPSQVAVLGLVLAAQAALFLLANVLNDAFGIGFW